MRHRPRSSHAPRLPAQAVVQIGGGRGFLVRSRRHGAVILTAAHCLPQLPPAGPISYREERTYPRLMGALGAAGTITVECAFVDPVHDAAILIGPDDQELSAEANRYAAFVDARPALRIGRFVAPTAGRIFTRRNAWTACALRTLTAGSEFLAVARARIQPGMSGSPILDADGRAVALVSSAGGRAHPGWPNPILALVLPAWALVDAQLL